MALKRALDINEGKKICKNIFIMIQMPLEKDRKRLMQNVEQFASILNRYEERKDRKVLSSMYIKFLDRNSNFYTIKENAHPKWIDRKIHVAIKLLRNRSFFKRFRVERIREMLDEMDLRIMSRDEILFFESDKVYVIISGTILMKSHEQNCENPETLGKFGEGSILNFLQEQSRTFYSIETWFTAQVETELAVFDKKYF